MHVFEPRTELPARGPLRIVGGGLLNLLRSLPALIGLGLILILVSTLALLAVALPAGIASAIDPWLAYLAGGLMLVLALPFLILWDSAGLAATLGLLGSRPLDDPLGARAAIGLGLRRALPMLGASILVAIPISLVALPLAFIGLAASFLWGYGDANASPLITALAAALGLLLPVLLFLFLFIFLRLAFTRFTVVFENLGPVASLERSWDLTAGQVPRLLLYALLALAPILLITLVATPAATFLGLPAPDYNTAESILESPTNWPPADPATALLLARALFTLLAPALGIALLALWFQSSAILLYFDTRRRKEGFGDDHRLPADYELRFDDPAPSPEEAEDPSLLPSQPTEPFPIPDTSPPEASLSQSPDLPPTFPDGSPSTEPSPDIPSEPLSSEPLYSEAPSPAPDLPDAPPPPPESRDDLSHQEPEGAPPAPHPDAPPTDPATGKGSGGKSIHRPPSTKPEMQRLIDMLPEDDPTPEPKSRPSFVDRLLGWLPAPEADPTEPKGPEDTDDAPPDEPSKT